MNLTSFRRNLLKPSVKLRYKVLYDSNDVTSQVLNMGTIRRDINLSAGKALVTLNNAGGWWNVLKDTNNALGATVEIQIFVQGDAANAYTLFKGATRAPVFEGSTVTISVKDHNSKFLDKHVGSNGSPEQFFQTQTRTADVIVWDLLTNSNVSGYAELSGLNSPANPDIYYRSFARWRDQHINAKGYQMTGRINGQTIGQLLMGLCRMTHSYMWVNNDGKMDFAPPFEPGFSYAEGNTGSEKKPGHGRDLILRDDLIINDVTVRYSHNFTTGDWNDGGGVNDTDVTSQAMTWGVQQRTIEGRVFAHVGATSATADRDATLVNYAFPLRFLPITAGFPAIMEDLGKTITVDDTLKSISGEQPIVEAIDYDLNNWEVKLKARLPW